MGISFRAAARGFKGLYEDVTRQIRRYRDARLTSSDWVSEFELEVELHTDSDRRPRPAILWPPLACEGDWVTYLVVGFWERYWGWENPTGPERDEVAAIVDTLRRRSTRPVTRVCGFAYLHICLDLPVVLCRSFSAIPSAVSRRRARRIYRDLDGTLERAFREHRFAWCDSPTLGLLTALGLFRLRARSYFVHWALLLRSDAWFHAEVLDDIATAPARERYVTGLAGALRVAVEEAARVRFWNVIPTLSKPSLALLALQLAACGGTASGAAEPMLGPLASWVVVIGLSLLLVHRVLEDWILAEIELVGRTVRRHVAGFHPNGGPAGEPGRDVEIVRG